MAAQADAVSAFIKAQGLTNPILIGHSMGGGVALRVAEQAGKSGQSDLKKLILIAPVAYPLPSSALGLDLGKLSMLLGLQDLNPSQVSRELVLQILKRAYADPSRITSQQVEGYAKGLSSRAQLQVFLEHSSKLSNIAVPATKFAGIKVKTLIVWGKQDHFVPLENGEKLKAALGNASLQSINDCGHIPQEEQPTETSKLIKAFL